MNEPWTIALLGGLRVQRGEQVVRRFRSQKTGALLGYLAYHLQQIHSREALLELFWPGSSPAAARNSLSVALSSLRHQLEPPGTPTGAVLRADRYSISFNPAAITTDVQQFENALEAAAKTGSTSEQVQYLSHAIASYNGKLLPGYYDAWITPEQERMDGLFLLATRKLIAHFEQTGDSAGALSYARRAISIDPFQEDAHADLMRLLVASGQPGAALRQYKELERLLEDEMGEEPSAPLRALFRQIEKETGLAAAAPASPAVSLIPTRPPRPALPVLSGTAAAAAGTRATQTFLLIDIEGSTAQWECTQQVRSPAADGATYHAALKAHHRVIRGEITRHGGQEVSEAGDSLVAAFAAAGGALACAVAAQQEIQAHAWLQETGPLRVRMALDTGDVEQEGGTFRGQVLHRASRMLTAAHGGQVLLSESTASLVRRYLDELAGDIRLVDLGIHRLRDVPTPERLFQVDYPGMTPGEFGPLSAEAGYPPNLPLSFTRFFGRGREIAELTGLLTAPPVGGGALLVTITGMGGTGKTRLALEVGEHLSPTYEGAVWFAPLADIADSGLISSVVCSALRLPRSPQGKQLEQVIAALAKQPSLLVLDNFEHLLGAASSTGLVEGVDGTVEALLSRVPNLRLLVTSRQVLGLPGEREFALAPLPTPNGADTDPWALEHLSLFDSVALFLDRAQAARPDFQITRGNAPFVAELCDRLEGIPLAIELAAARAQVLTPSQMLGQLTHRFEFLSSRMRGVTERQRTLKGAVDWSYQLLSPELQRFFRRLSVFRGGWTSEAAEAVCEEPLALDYLAQLRECSVVLTNETDDGMRFRMLETLREFAEEQLVSEERAAAERRHVEYYGQLRYLFGLPMPWVEMNNIHAAYERSATMEDTIKARLRFASAIGKVMWGRGRMTEALTMLIDLLAREDAIQPTEERALALLTAGDIASIQGSFRTAILLLEEALQICRAHENERMTHYVLLFLGLSEGGAGNYERARSHLQEVRELGQKLSQKLGDSRYLVNACNYAGLLALTEGNPTLADAHFTEGSNFGPSAGVKQLWLAETARQQGDCERASRLAEEYYRLGAWGPQRKAEAREVMGRVALDQSDLDAASVSFQESLSLYEELEMRRNAVNLLLHFAFLFAAQGQTERAARLLGAEEALRESASIPLLPCYRANYDRAVASIRAGLSEATFTAQREVGRAMNHEEAVAYALAHANTGSCVLYPL